MERLIQLFQDNVTVMLTVQYRYNELISNIYIIMSVHGNNNCLSISRMNDHIMSCSSRFFYENKLNSHSSVSEHTLRLVNICQHFIVEVVRICKPEF